MLFIANKIWWTVWNSNQEDLSLDSALEKYDIELPYKIFLSALKPIN